MKFEMFHLMPYRELPADFAEAHRSVWVDIPVELFDPLRAHHMYNDTPDELEFAAASGYDGVCVNEHHQNAYGMMPSPNMMAAALVRRTRDAALIVLGNSIALYNPPTRWIDNWWIKRSPARRTTPGLVSSAEPRVSTVGAHDPRRGLA